MCEIPWQNVTLTLFALAVREHPEWTHPDIAYLASDTEQHAIDRGAECVEQSDLRAILAARADETPATA